MTPRLHEIALPCDCAGTCSIALVTEWEPWEDEPQQFYVDFYAHLNATGNLHYRAGLAWKLLRGKDPYNHGVVFTDKAKVARLRDFLTGCLDSGPSVNFQPSREYPS